MPRSAEPGWRSAQPGWPIASSSSRACDASFGERFSRPSEASRKPSFVKLVWNLDRPVSIRIEGNAFSHGLRPRKRARRSNGWGPRTRAKTFRGCKSPRALWRRSRRALTERFDRAREPHTRATGGESRPNSSERSRTRTHAMSITLEHRCVSSGVLSRPPARLVGSGSDGPRSFQGGVSRTDLAARTDASSSRRARTPRLATRASPRAPAR